MYWFWENGIKEYLIMFLLKRGNDLNEALIIVTACFVKIWVLCLRLQLPISSYRGHAWLHFSLQKHYWSFISHQRRDCILSNHYSKSWSNEWVKISSWSFCPSFTATENSVDGGVGATPVHFRWMRLNLELLQPIPDILGSSEKSGDAGCSVSLAVPFG